MQESHFSMTMQILLQTSPQKKVKFNYVSRQLVSKKRVLDNDLKDEETLLHFAEANEYKSPKGLFKDIGAIDPRDRRFVSPSYLG